MAGRKPKARKGPATLTSPITAYDVARLAGVSQSAVSRTFTVGASVSERTRLKVMKAAKKLSYRPNFIARSLSTRRSDVVGVIVPSLENHFYSSMLQELSAAFGRTGRRMLLFTSQRDTAVEPILENVLHSRVDALVMVAASVSSRFAEECQKLGLPIVLLNRKTDNPSISSVTTANRRGAEMIADFLVAGNHQRFAYLAGLDTSSTSRDREEAFRNQLLRHGATLNARAAGNSSFKPSLAAARELLSLPEPPDAVFCCSDHMALAFINVARAEFGLRIGEDISVVGFDNSELSAWPVFDLTTFSQPIAAMAERVAEIIDNQLRGNETVSEVVVPGELIIRSSARIPRSAFIGPLDGPIWALAPRDEISRS